MTRGSAASVVGRVTGLTAIALFQAHWFLQPVPLAAKGLAAVLLVVSLARPASGLLVFAGLAPLSTVIAGLCGGGAGLGGQLLEQMALGIGAGVLLRDGATEDRTRIGAPALFMAVVAVASAAAMIPAAAAPIAHGVSDAGLLLQQLALRQTAQSSPVWAPFFAALTIAECGLLGWAVERTVRREPLLATRLVAMALIGHAGAAVLNFQAVLGGALRTGNVLEALPRLLLSVRISMQTDVHAAASALLLAGVAGLGLMDGSRARRVGLSLLLVLVATGLWITGSRVAIVLGTIITLATIGWLLGRSRRGRHVVVVGVVVVALAVGTWLTMYLRHPSATHGTFSQSASVRLVLMKAGLQMFEEMPIFGIGIAKFPATSTGFLGGSLGEDYRENAHNNFVQVLAEQGLVGFGALLWWLTVVALGAARAQVGDSTAVRGCLLAAIVACVGTWMTGHPLLVREFAFVFWLYCGILAGMTPLMQPTRRPWLPGVLVAGILLSLPARAYALRNAADLEHLGFGLSALWQHDDSQRYREAAASFALFLPATGRPVELPIRRAPGMPDPFVVDVSIRGRIVDTISVDGQAWQTVLVVVPRRSRRFELVDFFVHPQKSGADLPEVMLRVGKDVVR